jgi:transcriptional regulator with XRE-family HTH domain
MEPHPAALAAIKVLGQQIRLARRERNWTAAELAQMCGVGASTLSRIEAGDPGTAIGNVLGCAWVAGVPLFGAEDPETLYRMRRRGEEILALVPKTVRHPKDDDGPDF